MDHRHSYSFPGFGCLVALLTLWFVPYGLHLLTIVVMLLLFSGAVEWLSQVVRKISRTSGS
jgi:hypothetical protein